MHPNFRAVAALPAAGGRLVRAGILYRSGAWQRLDAEDEAAFDALTLAAVCDLRSASESARAPNDWLLDRRLTLIEMDVLSAIPTEAGPWPRLAADPTPAGAHAAMLALYSAMPAAAGPHVVSMMRMIADGSVPLLIHCTAGKDRTGFAVAALLRAAGVGNDDVVADYMMSAGRQNPTAVGATKRLAEERVGVPLDDATIAVLMGVTPAFIAASLTTIDRDFGGIEAYFLAFGADADLLTAFCGRLLD